MFKKILVPVDGSPFMPSLVEYSIEFARKLGSELKFLYVLDMPETASEPDILKQKQANTHVIEECKSKAQRAGIKSEEEIAVGRPGETIIRVAESEKFDLIIAGSRGYSHLRHILMGSVADQVVNHAGCAVLVTRPPAK
jgi:nucleotide-binding universal stress UspA family protein